MRHEAIDPFAHIARLRARVLQLLDEGMLELPDHISGSGSWTPTADVLRTPDGLVVELDLPGMDREEIEVTLREDKLTVAGYRKPPETAAGERILKRQRPFGAFSRSFTVGFLPTGVEAALTDGVLIVKLVR